MKSPKTFVREGRRLVGRTGVVCGKKSLVALVPLVCFLLVSLGASADMVPSNSGGVGTFEGARGWADEATGAAQSSYDFQLFAAHGDAQPMLRLTYAWTRDGSAAREAGHSWGLSLPIIERQPLQGGAPTFTDDERMAFSGQPLVFIGTVSSTSLTMLDGTIEQLPPWSAGTRYYRLQNDAHMRFFWSSDKLTWTVQSPSGVTMEFGRPTMLRGENDDAIDWADAFGHSVRWRLVRQYGAYGNAVVYHWHNLGRRVEEMPVLTDIYDTPAIGSTSLADFAHHTHIAYEATPTAGNPATNTVGYAPIWKQKYQVRIKRVDVAGNGLETSRGRAIARRYHLGYTMHLRRSMLTSIAQEGACANAVEAPIGPGSHGGTSDYEAPETNCPRLPATTYEYTMPPFYPGSSANAAAFSSPGGYFRRDHAHPPPTNKLFPNIRALNLLDIDRDGTADFVLQPALGKKEPGGLYLNREPAVDTRLSYSPVQNANGDVFAAVAGFTLSDPSDLRNKASVIWRDTEDTRSSEYKRHHRLRLEYNVSSAGYRWTDSVAQADITQSVVAVGDVDGNGTLDIFDTRLRNEGFPPKLVPVSNVNFGPKYKMASGHADVDAVSVPNEVRASVAYNKDVPFWALADLNGDGLDDLVTLAPKPGAKGDEYIGQPFIYFPGDGTGVKFGCDPARSVCHVPTEADIEVLGKTPWIDMPATSTQEYPTPFVWGRTLTNPTEFADLNQDGLTDVYQTGFQGEYGFATIWINEDGTHFHEIDRQSPGIFDSFRSLSGDITGNGTTDIVFVSQTDRAMANGNEGGYLEFFPELPGQLKKLKNGIGAETTFQYASLHDLDVKARGDGQPWLHSAPVPMQLVTEVNQRQPRVGNPNESGDGILTKYTYRDPAYDSFEHRVVGFGSVEVSNGRGSTVRTKYYFGRCFGKYGEGECTETSDVHYEKPFTGAPYQTDIRGQYGDGTPVHSTNATHYKVVRLYDEPGGSASAARRSVAFAYPDVVETYLYDNAPFVHKYDYIYQPLVDDSRVGTVSIELASDDSKRARLRREQTQDAFGNVRETRDLGRLTFGTPIDPLIKTSYDMRPVDDSNVYAFRPKTVTLSGNGTEPDRVKTFAYTPRGDVTDIFADLTGTLPLVRFHEKGRDIAPPPVGASADGTMKKLAHFEYTALGNLYSGYGPGGTGCFRVERDRYQYRPSLIEKFKTGCSGASFTEALTYDPLFEQVSTTFHADGSISTTTYDEFGRLKTAADNDPELSGVPAAPSELAYFLSGTTNTHAISVKSPIGAGRVATAWQFSDGFGQPIASVVEGDPSAGDPTPWIVQGAVYYTEARPALTYRPYATSDDPSTLTFRYRSQSDSFIAYDVFGRVTGTNDRGRRTETKYHALSVDMYDEEDLTPGPHANTPSTVTTDGHGRTVSMITRNAGDSIETKLEYNVAGQVTKITKSHSQGSNTFVRWMKYDTLGRLVLNAEPNTSKNFIANPNDPAALTSMRAWRYAYDDAGRLVGTSDARGCGKNQFYDGLGRVFAADYSPCLAHHEPYTPVDLATGAGAEAVYEYDTSGPLNSVAYKGRLTSVADRGARTHFGYDARGRMRATARQITRPASQGLLDDADFGGLDSELGIRPRLGSDDEDAPPPDRYTPHVYRKSFGYDLLDRLLVEESGADVPGLLGLDGKSQVGYAYTKRGLLQSVNSSYGPLIKSITYNPDGTPHRTTYDDTAITTVDMQYGDHDLSKYTIARSRLALWSNRSEYYSPADEATPSTLQKVLADLEFTYDGVGNPTAIIDKRNPDDWPAGAKPRTQTLVYDDLYRLTQERVVHAGGADKQVSPFAKEESTGNATMVPRLARDKRSTGFDIAYDFVGNTTSLTDSDATVLDRAHLGTTIINGDPGGHPNQLRLANAGVEARYDDGGNAVELRVSRLTDCAQPEGRCSHRFIYDWDELGQLVRARRWDFRNLSDDATTYPEVPSGTPSVDVRYAYSQGQRVLRSAKGATTPERHSVEVFGSLRLDNAEWRQVDKDYDISEATESAFLGGVAHVMVTEDNLPSMSSSKQHVFFAIGDRLGSTSLVIDKNTSELAESVAYHPYGTVDSDYRPERWGSHREVYQFTGKEADIDVGLTYFGARYYSTGLARWLSADPLTIHAMGSDLNPYAYVGGHAMQATDPNGLCYECGPAFGGGSWIPPSVGSGPGSDAGGGGGGGDGGYDPGKMKPNPLAGHYGGAHSGGGGRGGRTMAPPPPPAVTGPATGTWFGIEPSWFGGNTRSQYVAGVAEEFNAGIDKHSTEIAAAGVLAGLQSSIMLGASEVGAGLLSAGRAVSNGWTSLGQWAAAKIPSLVGVSSAGTTVAAGLNGNPAESAFATGPCFTEGTLVTTCDGSKQPIETIRTGDAVLSWNEASDAVECRKVLGTTVRVVDELVDLQLSAEANGHEQLFRATTNHPFWVMGKGWTPAGELALGDKARDADGVPLRVTNVLRHPERASVFNFAVEEDHTYFVGDARVLVHNARCAAEATIPWSSGSVSRAARLLEQGENSVSVASRAEAEELFLGRFQGEGYRNTTGLGNRIYDKSMTYHWDEKFGVDGFLEGHAPSNPHATIPHLQLHSPTDIIRIFFK